MSTIEKLSIQGIRSFGPNSDDMQKIVFTSPVTLILGANGCGKTTIIECLKYALTGESPPGSERGKSFIHDPKISEMSDTLGQIKLQVRNIRGDSISVCRSMKVSFKRGRFTFETLDSTVNHLSDPSITSGSISKRCLDVDTTMCEFMGVSKAIINNVLFCHQEDSSWPLDEGKKLKEKFDAIFGITEYNKAIEKLIKTRKEEMEDLKIKESNLRLLIHLKEEMESKTLALKKAELKSNAIKDQCAICDVEVKPIDERLQQIRKIEYEVGKYQALKVKYETKLKNCQDQIASLKKNIKQIFEGTIDELNIELQTFSSKMLEKQKLLDEQKEKLKNYRVEEKDLQKKLTELEKRFSVLMQQKKKEKECIMKRADKMKTLCAQLQIPITDVDLATSEESNVKSVLEKIQNSLMNEQCQIAELSNQHDKEDQQRQKEIDALRVDITKTEEGIATLLKQKSTNEKEHKETSRQLTEIELSATRLKKINQDIDYINEKYEKLNAEFKLDVIRQNITAGKEKVAQLQQQFRKIDERLTFLNSITKLTAEISLKEKELEKKEQDCRRIKNKHSDNFKKIFTRSVEINYRRNLQLSNESIRREIEELNKNLNTVKLNEQKFEIKRKNLKDDLSRCEKELEESKEKIFEVCHSTTSSAYEELLAKSKQNVTKLQLDHGALLSAKAMYNKYIKKIEEDPCCPLCHKDMSTNEASDITIELNDEIQQLPANITRVETSLKAEQKKYENLLHLKPIIEKVAKLEKEMPKRKQELITIQESLNDCVQEGEMLQASLAQPTSKIDIINTMMGDMTLLDEALKEITRLKDEITKLKAKLPEQFDDSTSLEDVQIEKSTIAGELENERKNVETKQHSYELFIEQQNKIREKKNALKDEQIRLQEGLQSLPQLKDQFAKLTESLEKGKIELEELKTKLQPLKIQLNACVNDKTRKKEENRKQITKVQNKLDTYRNNDHDIKRLHLEVLEYSKMNLELELTFLEESRRSTKFSLETMAKNITKLTESIDQIKTDCSNQEIVERNLKDNLELKQLKQKETELTKEKCTLTQQIGDLDFQKVSEEKDKLIKKRDEATVRKAELLGQIGEINNQMKKIQNEINEPKYKQSIENYRRAYYEVEVTKRVISDLGTYRLSLEWALMKFHSEKMKEINQLIREYWRLIYRGNDIDYIQIKTDENPTDSTADRRRNYNYHVVQSKNNCEIEMRGRCSAGQRVLACLIIRMALAETFSVNCGVLALDEPTTNLDSANIISLCEALNRIVEERQTQSNFMLIVITHDEDFISSLGKIKSYYRVDRSDECKSRIRKVNLE